jgi:hypothetical protein
MYLSSRCLSYWKAYYYSSQKVTVKFATVSNEKNYYFSEVLKQEWSVSKIATRRFPKVLKK